MASNLKTVLGLLLLLPVALAGCRSDVAGVKPGTDDGGVDQAESRRTPDAICPADAAGGGQCPINFCGQAKVGLPANQFPQSGADSLCGIRSCKVGPELSTGDGFQLVCVDPTQSALAFGAACSPDPARGMRCADDSLCITRAGLPAEPVLLAGCAATTPTARRTRAASSVPTPVALADGRRPVIGMCTPESKIAGKVCVREADCDAGSGLRPLRRAHEPAHLPGGRARSRSARPAPARPSAAAASASTATDTSAAARTAPTARARATSTATAAPISAARGWSSATTASSGDPLDDLVVGYCRTLFVAVAGTACASDADCVALQNGSDGCDVTHGLCYRKAAVPGSACTSETDCPVGGECSMGPRFPGGYCQTFGCDAGGDVGRRTPARDEQHLRAARRPRRADLRLLREVRPGRDRLQPRERAATRASRRRPAAPPSVCLVGSGT